MQWTFNTSYSKMCSVVADSSRLFFFYCCDKHHGQKQPREDRAYFFKHRDQNLLSRNAGQELKAETEREAMRGTAY